MTATTVLDVVLVLVLAAYAVGNYRTGLLAGAFSLLGFLGGGLLALWGLPGVIARSDLAGGDPLRSGVVLVVGVLIAAALGQALGSLVGLRLRSWVRLRPARALDSVLGAVAAVLVGATVIWLAAGAVIGAFPGTTQTVSGSRVVQTIDKAMPTEAEGVLDGVYRALGNSDVPRVFTGVRSEPIRPVDPPSQEVTQGPGIEQAAASVVKVTGTATDCGRGRSGSGWVAAPRRVVTNAHVVAGVDHPSVQVAGTGRTYPATTVAFDPRRDVAVLAVPELAAPPLPTGEPQDHGDPVVVAGFPLGGPYTLEPGRVREQLTARGAGIDGTPGVDRSVYAVNTRVEQGNSGGPLLSPSGQVVGTVFAKSRTDRTTGYALTLEETRPVLERSAGVTQPVSTGSCAA